MLMAKRAGPQKRVEWVNNNNNNNNNDNKQKKIRTNKQTKIVGKC